MSRPSLMAVAVLFGGSALIACGGSDSGGSVEAFCDASAEADDFDFDTAEPSDVVDIFKKLSDTAPSEISDDVSSVVGVLEKIADADDDPEKLAELEPEFENFQAASDRIEAFEDANC